MSPVLVDSNVLLDVMTEDEAWFAGSANTLRTVADGDRLVVNAVIFAEVSVGFDRIEDIETALPPLMFEREDLPYEAAFLAGKCFEAYRRRGGVKRSPMPDFFIGAHAAVAGYRLLTRDAVRYRTYFPRLDLVAPDIG